jgi:hypothetical protein
MGVLFIIFATVGLAINLVCVLDIEPQNNLVKHAMTIERSNYKASVDFLNEINYYPPQVRFNLFLSSIVKILALRVGYLMIKSSNIGRDVETQDPYENTDSS